MTPVQMHKPHLSRELATTTPQTLEQYADAINREYDLAERSVRTAVEHAMACGQLLLDAKLKVEHGQWIPWLEKHFHGSVRTAQNYMLAAGKNATVAHLPDVHTTLRTLYTAAPKPRTDHATPTSRLAAAVQPQKPAPAPSDPEQIVDATVVEDQPEDNDERDPTLDLPAATARRWSAALDQANRVQGLVVESGGDISPASAAEALTDAASLARDLAAKLYDLAGELRKLDA